MVRPFLTFLVAAAGFAFLNTQASAYPIAGLTPSERPAGAPKITTFVRPKDWREDFFQGVTKPYPPSLVWEKDQGAWHTPFNHPGMTGPYDLRNWHD
jgi:hypothetical protein